MKNKRKQKTCIHTRMLHQEIKKAAWVIIDCIGYYNRQFQPKNNYEINYTIWCIIFYNWIYFHLHNLEMDKISLFTTAYDIVAMP